MKTKRKVGDESEKRGAKKVGGKKVKGSGCLWYNRGDYETDRFVYQNKFTSKDFYVLTISDLEKAKKAIPATM